MNVSFPVADSLKVHSRCTPGRETRIALKCPIPCETLLRDQFIIHFHIFLGRKTIVGVYANLYCIQA
jgi:hypothetical protein